MSSTTHSPLLLAPYLSVAPLFLYQSGTENVLGLGGGRRRLWIGIGGLWRHRPHTLGPSCSSAVESSVKKEIIVSSNDKEDQPPQTPILWQDAVYAVKDTDYKQ